MIYPVKETIRKRKSVRSFDGRPVSRESYDALAAYVQQPLDPFDAPVTFRLLDAKTHDLSSPVVTGADLYMAAKVSRTEDFELALGYSFENACLYALSLGLGTVMLAASISRPTFEKAMELAGDEVMPVASPVGYPAAKRSIRESLMRKGLKADERLPFENTFFKDTYGAKMTKSDAGEYGEALEMVRWAPSAVNKQPWRAVVSGDQVHFFEVQTLKASPIGDIQKVDMGIALAHFDLTMQEEGRTGRFVKADPDFDLPANTHYTITYVKE